MNLEVAKYSSNPGSTPGWSQIHDFTPDDPEKRARRGRLLAVISAPAIDGGPLEKVEKGREILLRIHEEYFGNLEDSPFEALKRVLAGVGGAQTGLLAVVERKVVFGGNEGVSGFCLRGGVLAKILSSDENRKVGAGAILEGDAFIFANDSFLEGISLGVLKASLSSPSAESALESLNSFLPENPKGPLGAFVLMVKRENQQARIFRIKEFGEQDTLFSGTPAPGPARQKLARVIERILSKLPERKISLRADIGSLEERKNRNTSLLVGGLLLLLLLISIFFGVRQKNIRQTKEKYEERLNTAEYRLEEAISLSDLNSARARELLLLAKEGVEELKKEGFKDARIMDLEKRVNENIGAVAGIYEVDPEMYLDLSLLSDGFKGDEISFSEGRMLILDKSGKLASVEIASKKSRMVAGPDKLAGAKYVSAYADRNYVLADDGIWEIGEVSDKVLARDWSEAGGFQVYSGNVYILDKGASKIWRYTGTEGEFSSQEDWFAPGIEVSLGGVTSWAIDGSIWLLTGGGEIEKYVQGSPQDFSLRGVDGGFEGAACLFADETGRYLYVLDPNRSRVVVLDKQGNYRGEYLGEKIKEATRLVVSEADRKIILLAGSKLYSVETKHLD